MGTHMKVLGESFPMNTNMTGFQWFSKIFASWMKETSALEGLRVLLEIVVWINHTFGNNYDIKEDF